MPFIVTQTVFEVSAIILGERSRANVSPDHDMDTVRFIDSLPGIPFRCQIAEGGTIKKERLRSYASIALASRGCWFTAVQP